MEIWAFDFGPSSLILRRMPAAAQDADGIGKISTATEAAIVAIAGEHGVITPEMLGVLAPEDELGTGFLMRRANGEAMPHKILGDAGYSKAMSGMAAQCAKQFALIHKIDPKLLPSDVPVTTPQLLLEQQRAAYIELKAHIPTFEYAFHWLEHNLPDAEEPVFLHGDFRMGNILIEPDSADPGGLSAVLDWELAHLGDPLQDLAYFCTPNWRFGHYDKPVGGFADTEELLTAYEAETGKPIDRKRFQFWLIYSTLWWGNCCLRMIAMWREGIDRSLERTVIGRRVSEAEIDLLLLLEEEFYDTPTQVEWQEPSLQSYGGESDDAELLEALINWDKKSVIPNSDGRDLFQARVAKNALGILQRKAQYGAIFAARNQQRLSDLGLSFGELSAGLSNGSLSIDDPKILGHLKLSAMEHLRIDQPHYAGLKTATAKWSDPS